MKLIYALALLPLVAYAGEKQMPKHPTQAQYQDQDQHQRQDQSQSQEQANAQSVEFKDRLQAPSVYAPSIAPTAPCYYSASGGLAVPGFGASGGKAIKDQGCEDRETARLFYQMGFVDQAVAILCKGREGCPWPNGKPVPPVPPPVVEPVVCPASEVASKVLEKCVAK